MTPIIIQLMSNSANLLASANRQQVGHSINCSDGLLTVGLFILASAAFIIWGLCEARKLK